MTTPAPNMNLRPTFIRQVTSENEIPRSVRGLSYTSNASQDAFIPLGAMNDQRPSSPIGRRESLTLANERAAPTRVQAAVQRVQGLFAGYTPNVRDVGLGTVLTAVTGWLIYLTVKVRELDLPWCIEDDGQG